MRCLEVVIRGSFAAMLFLAACDNKSAGNPAPSPPAVTGAPQHTTTAASAMPAATSKTEPTKAEAPVRQTDTVPTSDGDLRITPIQHATLLLEWSGKAIYADPTAEGKYEGLPKADVIVVTHAHGDHLSPPTIASLKKDGATIIAPASVASSLPPEGVTVLKNGESRDVAGIRIEAVPMYNLVRGPSAGKLFHDKGWGNGYVLTIGGKRVYLSGDTECTPEMKALKNIDVAFVCMNLPYTMTPAEAATCVKAFSPKIVYPYHYRGQNVDEFKDALKDDKNVEVRTRNWYP